MHTEVLLENVKGTDPWGELDIEGVLIIVRLWAGF
jgi:hypothetical protein